MNYLATTLKDDPELLSVLDCHEHSSAPLYPYLTVLCTTADDGLELLSLGSVPASGKKALDSKKAEEVAKSLKALGPKFVVIKPSFQAPGEPIQVIVYGDNKLHIFKSGLSTSRLPAELGSVFAGMLNPVFYVISSIQRR